MKIAIIDADLIGRKRHRFPNLTCMKMAGYYKHQGDSVELKTDYENLDGYDKVLLAKVFTDTEVPKNVLERKNIKYGGTGFFYDKAPALPAAIEHHMPDYHLYDTWLSKQTGLRKSHQEYKYYTDYSIGFLTRGCFRKCPFCVNKNKNSVKVHSSLNEFFDQGRRKICLLDDNFLGSSNWRELLMLLQNTGRPFQFKQGLDERLLTPEKCSVLFSSKYDGEYIFAFDNVADQKVIEDKLDLIRKYTNKILKFYCFCGFDRSGDWNQAFWAQDIFDLFIRIKVLMRYKCLPYIMRFARYNESPFRGVYISIARWCNQPNIYKKKSLREFAILDGEQSACYRYLQDFEKKHPEIAPYYDLKY